MTRELVGGPYCATNFVSTMQFIRANPDVVEAYLASYNDALKYALEHDDEMIALAKEHWELTDTEAEMAWELCSNNLLFGHVDYTQDPCPADICNATNKMFELWTESGGLPEKPEGGAYTMEDQIPQMEPWR